MRAWLTVIVLGLLALGCADLPESGTLKSDRPGVGSIGTVNGPGSTESGSQEPAPGLLNNPVDGPPGVKKGREVETPGTTTPTTELPTFIEGSKGICQQTETCRFPRRDNEVAWTIESIVDDQGRVVVETRKHGPSVPPMSPGPERNEFTYAPEGYLAKRSWLKDHNRDGQYDRRISWWFDAQGRTIRTETDLGADGNVDQIELRSWNELGQLVTQTTDLDGDGIVDIRFEADYLGLDRPLAKRWYKDGVLSQSEHYVYDAKNRLVRLERDTDGDGQYDTLQIRTIVEVSGAELVQIDYTADGKVDRIEQLTRDHLGRVVLKELDLNADGVFTHWISTEWSKMQRVIETRVDKSGNGEVDQITVQTYDLNNRLLCTTVDSNADQKIDGKTSYNYDPVLQKLTLIEIQSGNQLVSRSSWSYRADGQLISHVVEDQNGATTWNERVQYFDNGWRSSSFRQVVDIKYHDTKVDQLACSYQYSQACKSLKLTPLPIRPDF